MEVADSGQNPGRLEGRAVCYLRGGRVCEDATTSDGTICPDGGMVTREKKVGAVARGS